MNSSIHDAKKHHNNIAQIAEDLLAFYVLARKVSGHSAFKGRCLGK